MAKPELRLSVIQVAFALGTVALLARAAQVQLVEGARYAEQASAQRTERVELPAARGTIYDRAGTPLAISQERFHIGVAPNELTDTAAAVRALVRHLGLSEREVRRAIRSRRWAYFHGPFSSAQVHPLRPLGGIHFTSTYERFYPDPDFAFAVLGRPAADGSPAGGIERVFDDLLAGTPGGAVVLRDGDGRVYESPSRLDAFPVPGEAIFLTLDAGVQEIVETALAEALERFGAAGGDILVMDPHTGEILGLSSLRADGTRPATAFNSTFEPGSTAKVFVAAALLEHGLVAPTDSVWGEHGRWRLPYRYLEDEHPVTWATLEHAIQVSSNIATVKFATRLSPEQQYGMLRTFGFGTPTGIEVPSESRGRLPLPRDWSGTTAQGLAIGYEIAVTPLQLAQAYAAIANGGLLLRPAVVRRIERPDGSARYQHRPEPVRRVVSAANAGRLRTMLLGTTVQGGTGASAALSRYEVAGKTGTARVAGPNGQYVPGAYTAIFASLFPADDPQLVMVVKLDEPRGGYFASLTAAPVTRRVLEQLLAATTGAIDRRRLSHAPTVASRPAALPVAPDRRPLVVAWPDTASAEPPRTRAVPDVTGLSVREAVARLHRRGLRARVEGGQFGRVVRTRPAAGDSVATGGLVVLVPGGGGVR